MHSGFLLPIRFDAVVSVHLLRPATVCYIWPVVFIKTRSVFKLLLIYIEEKIPLFPGFRGQRCPGNREVLLAETQEAASTQDSIPDASSCRVKHDVPNVTEFFPLRVFDISPNDFTRPINVCAFVLGSQGYRGKQQASQGKHHGTGFHALHSCSPSIYVSSTQATTAQREAKTVPAATIARTVGAYQAL